MEEGYCNVCGMAAAVARAGSPAAPPPAAGPRPGAADPLAAIIPGVVPASRQRCSGCDAPLSRDSGICPRCGRAYSLLPALAPGQVVNGRYAIKGTLAFGGLGWIYLARDNLLARWVALKGLFDARDPRMLEVAVAEREFLAKVKHPGIVGIYDFIHHGDQGYIVMEYVHGKTLMGLRRERGGPLPPAVAVGYVEKLLPAFAHLAELGLVYCDLKPENVMVEGEAVKLIDLGAVRRADDARGDVYGSRGYTAPEAHERPSPRSDLYSIGRALAVLVADFDFQGAYEDSLPPAGDVPVFARHEALYRFLIKATRARPEDRFQSAAEMGRQLRGVRRRLLAGAGVDPGREESEFFAPEAEAGSDPLPRLKVDAADAGAGVVAAAALVHDPARRVVMFTRALAEHAGSLELRLRLADELIGLGRFPAAEAQLAEAAARAPRDPRVAWYRGRALLARGAAKEAAAVFEALSDELPGELGPILALGLSCEEAGEVDRAIRCFDAVSEADPGRAGAALRLGRCLARRGDRAAAAAAYRRVPPASAHYAQAQLKTARLLLEGAASLDDLLSAAACAAAVEGGVEGVEVEALRAEIWSEAARAVGGGDRAPAGARVLGVRLDEGDLRRAAEGGYRSAARLAKTEGERWALVDRANQVRPRTWL